MSEAPDYAFPHSADDESRRLELFQERLDPLTIRRIERLGSARAEVSRGRRRAGSITRWLADRVGPTGGDRHRPPTRFPQLIDASNVEVIRHDVRTDTFPEQSFDLVHTRAVLMHLPDDLEIIRRMVSWLRPGGWLLLEEPDFGMWLADADPVWATHPDAWHQTFPNGSLSRGRSLLGKSINSAWSRWALTPK